MTLTLDEVRKTKFHMARRTGYEVSEVDLFVDRVEASFAQLTEENQLLKQQVEALKQAADQADKRREPSNEEIRRQQTESKPKAATPAPGRSPQPAPPSRPEASDAQKIVVTASSDASPAVVRLVQMATEQSETLVNEAQAEAKRRLGEAESQANQITSEARTKADRVESEARVNAEKMTSEAQSRAAALDREVGARRVELFADLESERDKLRTAVSQLRGYENDYRKNLTGHLKKQIASIEAGVFEPSEKPGLLSSGDSPDRSGGSGTSTPRLDALAGENNQRKS